MRLALAFAATIALFGCRSYDYDVPLAKDSPWPKFRRDARQTGFLPVRPRVRGGDEPWSFRTGKGIFSSPVIGGDGTIYVGSADRTFYALDEDGSERWSVLTGEIIDSAALLDDAGRVYFGSGDGVLRALDAESGEEIWTFAADDPSEAGAFIQWFEGNVAMTPEGDLLVPNDNYFVYCIDRQDGSLRWKFEVAEQTWSLPAVDAERGVAYFGNNNVVEALGDNTFAVDVATGEARWSAFSAGTIAASPLVTEDGLVVLGGFDGFLYAYDADSGALQWRFGARDHLYASPASLSDGTLVQPAADGTIYAIDPTDGSLVWAFDTGEAIRSSAAVDAEDHVYVGSGEGRLYVLEPDGTLRYAMQLVDDPRNDLNSSPALGEHAVYIAGESGEIFSVPYDWCLDGGANDPRCLPGPGEDLPAEGVHLLFTTRFGATRVEAPTEVDGNATLGFSLVVREAGDTVLAVLDTDSIEVETSPSVPVQVVVSGDRRFLTVEPVDRFVAASGDSFDLTLRGTYLVDLDREGLVFTGGDPGGTFEETYRFTVPATTPAPPAALPVPVPATSADPAFAWELSRLAAPLPTVLPSYNQIGFDSLHFLVGTVAGAPGQPTVAWLVGAKLAEGENRTVVDPETEAMFPLTVTYDEGEATFFSDGGFTLEVMNAQLAFDTFRVAARLDGSTGGAVESAQVHVTLACADLGFFAPFVRDLGFCNPQTDRLDAFGAVELDPWGDGVVQPVTGVGDVAFTVETDAVVATIAGSSLRADEHAFGLLLLDGATGAPMSLSYGVRTTKHAAGDGTVDRVAVAVSAAALPESTVAVLLVDTYPAVREALVP